MWKSKGSPDKSIKPSAAVNNSLAPTPNHINAKLQVKFDGHRLKQDKVTFTHKQVVNIVYNKNVWSDIHNHNFTLENYLFGPVS